MIKKNVSYKNFYKPHEQKMSPFWWMGSFSNIIYMLRELSSLFFSLFGILFAIWLTALFLGREHYECFMNFFFGGFNTTFLFITFIFSLLHAFSWFSAMPKAMEVRINGKDLPDKCMISSCYIVFFIITIVVLALAIRFFN